MRDNVIRLDGQARSGEDHSVAVYRYALSIGSLSTIEGTAEALHLDPLDVRAAVEVLLDSKLLRREDDDASPLVPVDPELAAALLVSPMEREIYQRRERIAEIRERADYLRKDYARGGKPGHELSSVEQAVGAMEVRGYLGMASETCREDVMVLLSGKQEGDDLDDLEEVCLRLAEQQVRVRIICQHRCRADLVVRNRIKALADAGIGVRTVSHVPRAAVVFDRSLALLMGENEHGEGNASRVSSATVVEFLLDMFDHLWDVATPLGSFESGYAEVADDLQQTIAGLMAKGFTDEVLARKLGMSVRTCRRHIATLMRDLDAVSRFQAGAAAARRGLVEDEDA